VTTEAEFEERHRFLRGDGGKALLRSIGESVSALHWAPPHAPAAHHNGSIFFINTGQGIFGITAKHVYEGYLLDATQRGPVICQIDNMRFEPIQRFVSQGEKCDIATCRITEAELRELDRMTIP
jgi:hypothetical protein